MTPALSKVLVSTTRVAIPLVCVVEVICVGLPHMVHGITFPEKCCTKAELATLELQDQPLFDVCESFEGFGQLN